MYFIFVDLCSSVCARVLNNPIVYARVGYSVFTDPSYRYDRVVYARVGYSVFVDSS